MKILKLNIKFLFLIIVLSVGGYFQPVYGQICSKVVKSKYVSIYENITSSSNISALTNHSVVTVKDGFWLCGLATLTSGDIDFFYARLNDTGKLLYFKTVGLNSAEGGYSVRCASTPSGGLIITGQSFENSIGIKLAAIVSIDNQGSVKWYRKSPSAGNTGILDAIRGVFVEQNGDVFCVGDAQQYSALNYSRVLVCKLDSSGNQKFINQINLSINGNNQQAHPSGIQKTPQGYLISGWISSSQIPFLLLVNQYTGASISARYFNSSRITSPDKLIYLPSGKAFLVGYTFELGDRDGFVAAVDLKSNSILWQKAIGTSPGSSDMFNHVYFENNTLYMSVQTDGLGASKFRQGFVGIDTLGNLVGGNGIYFGVNKFGTAHSGIDFDVLKNGGAIFYGQDDASTNAHINFAMLSPCELSNCANHSHTYISDNTTLTIDSATNSDYTQGDLTSEYPTVQEITMIQDFNCIAHSINPNSTKFTYHICNGDSMKLVNSFRKKQGVYIDSSHKNYLGADSIIIHELFVHFQNRDTIKFHLCKNQKIVINGKTYSNNSSFNVIYKNMWGCDSVITYQITQSNISANFGVDSSLSPVIQFQNKSLGATKYFWDFGDQTFDSSSQNPNHTYNNDNYKVSVCLTIIDSFGCRDTICQTLEISKFVYWLVNTFTPGNGDGFNDVFKIGHKGNNFYYDIQVFSRWGVLVYETEHASIKDVSKFWNGKVMNTGTDCPAGTYFVLYNLYVNGENNPPKNVHGVITLIRD